MNKEPKIRSLGMVLTANTANTVYTCPPNYIAKMVLLNIANHAGSKSVQVQWNDISASGTYHIVNGHVLSAHDFFRFDTSYLVLNPGDTVIVTPQAGSIMDATITVEEHYEQGLF